MRFTLNADGAQAAGQGIGSIFKAMAMAPVVRQQAEQDAIKSAADIYYRRMAGDKYGAEAEGLRMTNTARQAPIDTTLPDYVQAAKRAFQDTGDTNMENYAKAVQFMQRVRNVDNVIADPAKASAVGQAYAATQGKPLFGAVGNTGVSLNQFTGQQTTTNPELMDLFSRVQKSIWNENNAQAGQANAAAGLSNARRARVESGLDKLVTVQEDDGAATIVAVPTQGDMRTVGTAVPKGTGVDATNAKTRNAIIAAAEKEMPGADEASIAAEVEKRLARRGMGANKNPAPAPGQPKIQLPQGYTADRALSEAKAAIAAGKDRSAVIQRLRDMGVEPKGL